MKRLVTRPSVSAMRSSNTTRCVYQLRKTLAILLLDVSWVCQSEFAYTLFAPVDLVSDGATCPKLFGRQPLRSHLSARLCSLWPELFFFTMTHVPPPRHILHQRPHVQCIGIISHNRSTRLYIAYLSDVFLCHTQQGLLCMTVL